MKNGKVEANVTKASLEEEGKTLEELFFEITEGEKTEKDGPLDDIFGKCDGQ